MSPVELLSKYYAADSKAYTILLKHSTHVAQKAVSIARSHPELKPDIRFVAEAAMLHDIGIFLTNAPSIGCFGSHQYIEHGYLGAEILREEGLPRHALVCERHTGTGLRLEEIIGRGLPLPHRDMQPQSIEEEIICFADKFFSKTKLERELTLEEARRALLKFGAYGAARFDSWTRVFLGRVLGERTEEMEAL